MIFSSFEYFPRMIYHGEFALSMEMCIPDPNECPFPYIQIFDLDRTDDFRDAIDHGYLDVAASYGDLYRMIPLDIAPPAGCQPEPRYAQYRTRMQDANGYVVAMQTELSAPGSPWAAGITPRDIERMQCARAALEQGDLETAAHYGKLYRLEPVDIKPAAKPWRPSERLSNGTPS